MRVILRIEPEAQEVMENIVVCFTAHRGAKLCDYFEETEGEYE
jgi:hypothetical protein